MIEMFESSTQSYLLKGKMQNISFLITGATGLIGSTLLKFILSHFESATIICPVRNKEKAINKIGIYPNVSFVECDLQTYIDNMDTKVDYIIHCASPTNGKYMTEHPVETYELAVETTRGLLQYAKNNSVKGMVYVSSLEYYGENDNDDFIKEDFLGYVNPSSPRSSYPLGKRAAEYLCTAYAQQYGVNVKIARLTQTFGPGVAKDDNRVFAQFARSVINNQDIVLHTKGESAKPYCYSLDCASAILCILMNGEKGEAYNVANQDTYISVADMARFLKDEFNPNINIRMEEHPEMGYAPVTKLHLSSEKLMNLGWKPQYSLKEMFAGLICEMKID